MRKIDDFQLEERVEENFKRKRSYLRWGFFGINLVGFLLSLIFILITVSEVTGVHYFGSSFRDTYRSVPHILWVPMLLWFFALVMHLASVLIETGKLDKQIASRARAEEEQVIEVILQRLAQAEKRKRDPSRLDDNLVIRAEEIDLLSRLESEEHPRHALL